MDSLLFVTYPLSHSSNSSPACYYDVIHNSCKIRTHDLPDMHALSLGPAALGLMHTYQANHLCLCYNYNMYTAHTLLAWNKIALSYSNTAVAICLKHRYLGPFSLAMEMCAVYLLCCKCIVTVTVQVCCSAATGHCFLLILQFKYSKQLVVYKEYSRYLLSV